MTDTTTAPAAPPANRRALRATAAALASQGSRWWLIVIAYALLLVIPSELVIAGPLKSNGGPVRLVGLLCMFLVVAGFLRWGGPGRVRPVAALLIAYLTYSVFAWGMVQRRPLTGGTAYADRQLLSMISVMGIALLCALVVTRVRQAHVLVGCLVFGAALSALVGVLQYAGVIVRWVDVLDLPFMTTHVAPGSVTDRDGLARVSGAASHPIEFSVTLAMLLPFAIHLASHSSTVTARRWALAATAVIICGFPLGLSRSGLLAILITVLLYARFLPGRSRVALLAGTALVVAAAVVVAPQITTTFQTMIGGAAEDNSITGRLDDYPRAFAQWAASPWTGGAPNDISVTATVLDNQWLATLVSGGLIGVAALAFFFFAPALMAGSASRRAASTPAARSLNGAIAAAAVAGSVCAGTFDYLAFQQVTFLTVMLFALVGVGSHPADAATPRS